MTTIASLDRIGGRRQQRVIKKRQGFFKMRREDLLEGLANPREPLDPLPQLFQLAQGGLRAATPVKQRLDVFDDLAQCAPMRQATRDVHEPLTFARLQSAFDA